MAGYIQEFINRIETKELEELKKHPLERDYLPIEISDEFFIDCIIETFMGENWYVVDPLHSTQINTIVLDEILYRHCKEYKKYVLEKKRFNDSSIQRKTKYIKEFIKNIEDAEMEELKKPKMKRNIFPMGTDDRLFVRCIMEWFMGNNRYENLLLPDFSLNGFVLDLILYKYNRKYKKSQRKIERAIKKQRKIDRNNYR